MPIKVLELHHHGIRIGKTTDRGRTGSAVLSRGVGAAGGYRTAQYPRYPWLLGVRRRQRTYGADPSDGCSGKIADGAQRHRGPHDSSCGPGGRGYPGGPEGVGPAWHLVLADSGIGRPIFRSGICTGPFRQRHRVASDRHLPLQQGGAERVMRAQEEGGVLAMLFSENSAGRLPAPASQLPKPCYPAE